jgi:hypothetical protein
MAMARRELEVQPQAYPPLPGVDEVAQHFARALQRARRDEKPYLHWSLDDVFPLDMCTGILTLPIAPAYLGATDGTRNTYNDRRTFLTPSLRARFPSCRVLAEALQRPQVARLFQDTLGKNLAGGHLRIEYIQDIDGMWLEPHTDIPDKLFSMVVYLCTGPEAKDWGTDIYDDQRRWVGRTPATFNSAAIFVPGKNTWHGFEKRRIDGVRRLMEVNYVQNWRDREQLCFPDRPIALG